MVMRRTLGIMMTMVMMTMIYFHRLHEDTDRDCIQIDLTSSGRGIDLSPARDITPKALMLNHWPTLALASAASAAASPSSASNFGSMSPRASTQAKLLIYSRVMRRAFGVQFRLVPFDIYASQSRVNLQIHTRSIHTVKATGPEHGTYLASR